MIEVSVCNSTGAFLDVVLDAIDPQFQEQLNNPGSYQFNLHVDSDTLKRTPSLLDYGNIVKLTDGKSGHVFAGIIEAKQRKLVADRSAQVWQVSGRGYLAALQDAVVYPEYGLVRFRGDSRPFNFASLDGPWRVTAEWAEPMFGPWGSSDVGFRKGSPADWPDPLGEWMWPSPGPTDLNMPEETAHFRRQFTTATTAMYRFYCTGDNEFDLWVNGEMVLSGTDWGTTYSVDVWVPAGDTLVAIEGRNWPQLPSTTSTAGVLFAMYSIAGDGTTGSIQRRSTSGAGWIARLDNPDPPGWNPGQVLSTLIAEAQNTARGGGVAALAPMTVTWTDTADTDGNPWTTIVDRTFPIGDDYLDVATQLAELGVDIRVNGETLALEMRQHQGVDRTTDPGGVVLSAAGSLTDADYQGDASAERSTVLVQGADGRWYERGITPSPPRREAALQVGNATSQRQVDLVVDQTLAANGSPAEQYTATAADTGPVPFSDFAVGDDVLIPDTADGTVGQRVMAITARQQDRTVTYTPELGAILKSREQRQAQALTAMQGPSLGGRVTNASPVPYVGRVTAAIAGAATSTGGSAAQQQTGYIASAQTFGGLTVTSVTASIPSTRVAGDLLVAVVGRQATMNETSGTWALAARVTSTLNANQLAVFYKVSDGTETTVTFTTTGAADALAAVIGVYRGVDQANPIGAINATGAESQTSSYVFPAPTVAAPGGEVVVYGVLHDSSASNEANGDTIAADPAVSLREYLSSLSNARYSMVLCDEGSPTDPSTVRDFSDPTADSWTDHTWKGVTLALRFASETPVSTTPLFADDLSGTPLTADSGDQWLYPDS